MSSILSAALSTTSKANMLLRRKLLSSSRDICHFSCISKVPSTVTKLSTYRPRQVFAANNVTYNARTYSSKSATESSQRAKRCQFCGATNVLAAAICESCASPTPIPEEVSYYSYFPGLTPPPAGDFDINIRDMRREFLKMQQRVHPDRFSHDDKKRLVAESTSSLLNKAYTTLQQPLSRAEYLLSINGVEMSAEGEKLTDSEVLMTVMEAREQIEEAQSEQDLEGIKEEAKELIKNELSTLTELFSQRKWQEAKVSAVKLRYWLNIQKAAADWEPGSEIRLEH